MAASVEERFFRDSRLCFPSLIHESAFISPTAHIGQGCFVGPLAVINTASTLGDFCLINTNAIIEHDCVLGDFVTVNPKAIALGSVRISDLATLGSNAAVRDTCSVAAETLIGMGAVVVKDIDDPLMGFWGGIPAKPVFQPSQSASNGRLRWCYKKPFSSENFLKYLAPSLAAGHMTNNGPLQVVIEGKLKHMVRSNREVLMACNGTAALHALVAGIYMFSGHASRWVTQAFTFPSSIQGPLSESIVSDIDPVYHGPCMRFLEEHQSEFDGVIVTNVFGHLVDVLHYESWCQDHGKYLVFDNAASPVGFLRDGRCIHDVGAGAIISLHETKPFGRGEGGAILTSRDVAPFVHRAMNFGFDISNQQREPNRQSSNWRMSDIAAAGICDHFDTMISKNWEERLQELTRFAIQELTTRGHQLAFPIAFPTILSCLFIRLQEPCDAEATCGRLNNFGIEAKHYYCPLVSRAEAPESWKLYDSTVCLPFHLGLSEEDIGRMIHILG
jgi:dTDP-4-amino-4,6-dideoxygalactose transaminase/acetyltransferase-like isoleucine patch superfamily enzyme